MLAVFGAAVRLDQELHCVHRVLISGVEDQEARAAGEPPGLLLTESGLVLPTAAQDLYRT